MSSDYTDMVCERHPHEEWPHTIGLTSMECAGPGMPAPVLLAKWNPYQPRPLTIWACKMPADFAVKTLEGLMEAEAGDYLVEGTHGEFYPVKAEIFEHKYNNLDARVKLVVIPEANMERTRRAAEKVRPR